MLVFVALNHLDDSKQVNISMSDGAASGNWRVEQSSSATLDFEYGKFWQTTYSGHPTGDRELRGLGEEPLLILKQFTKDKSSGQVVFSIEDGSGTFGTKEATWTRLDG